MSAKSLPGSELTVAHAVLLPPIDPWTATALQAAAARNRRSVNEIRHDPARPKTAEDLRNIEAAAEKRRLREARRQRRTNKQPHHG